MAGYTDSAFRQIVKKLAPDTICITELISADGIKFKGKRTMEYLDFDESERPLIVQLFGKKPDFFQEAAQVVEAQKADGVNINMGCPARKVIGSMHGSALLTDPNLAEEIARTTVKATKLPVSIKMRIGFKEYDKKYFLDLIKRFEQAGIESLIIHGRTTSQGFSGEADWKPIYLAKKTLKIPVIGNGDITSAKIAKKRLKNLDGIMVGRATFGNPWIMAEIQATLEGKKYTPPQSLEEKIPLILEHARLAIESKDRKGLLEMRKHLAAYIKGFPGASKFRGKLVQVESLKEIEEIFDDIIV
ncbi:tRNA dihydrouridine synthase DusB [Patescibacteria group bacterium]|nr:tRNA dihydrouridine synthase DusB [Patescibacteria group bacterium]